MHPHLGQGHLGSERVGQAALAGPQAPEDARAAGEQGRWSGLLPPWPSSAAKAGARGTWRPCWTTGTGGRHRLRALKANELQREVTRAPATGQEQSPAGVPGGCKGQGTERAFIWEKSPSQWELTDKTLLAIRPPERRLAKRENQTKPPPWLPESPARTEGGNRLRTGQGRDAQVPGEPERWRWRDRRRQRGPLVVKLRAPLDLQTFDLEDKATGGHLLLCSVSRTCQPERW